MMIRLSNPCFMCTAFSAVGEALADGLISATTMIWDVPTQQKPYNLRTELFIDRTIDINKTVKVVYSLLIKMGRLHISSM